MNALNVVSEDLTSIGGGFDSLLCNVVVYRCYGMKQTLHIAYPAC